MSEQEIASSEDTRVQKSHLERVYMWVWILVQAGIAINGLLVIGYLLARVVVGERWKVVAFTNNFVPWIAVVGLILSLIALFSRYRWVLIALQLPSIIACLVLYGALFLPKGSTVQQAGRPELTVATYNAFG
jgi:hypothetical protein